MPSEKPNEWWGFPINSRKAHFFKPYDRISLCGKWMYFGNLENDKHNSPDNCASCRKIRDAMERKKPIATAPKDWPVKIEETNGTL